MLEVLYFFISIFIVLILFAIIGIIIIGIPVYRFINESSFLIVLYNEIRPILNENFSIPKGFVIIIKCKKEYLEFSSSEELNKGIETLITKALSDYRKIDYIAKNYFELRTQREKLLSICAKIQTLEMKNSKE